jgi:hypothetical protein
MRNANLLLLLFLLWGCTASRPALVTFEAGSNLTRFESPKVRVGNIGMSGGLTSGQRVMMKAFASCAGRGCKPEQVEIVFLNDSSSDLNLDYRRVQIVFRGNSLDWEDRSRVHEPLYYHVPRGEFTRVPLSWVDFVGMATAPDVDIFFGLTGATHLRMPIDRREGLRELVHAIDPARK